MNISNAVANTRKISLQVVNFIITPQTNKCDCFNIDDACVMNKLNIHNNKIDEVVINKYEHLHYISLPKPNRSDVTVLIGSYHPELLLHQEFKIGEPGDLVAVKTKLGWMFMGGKRQLVNRSQCNYLSEDNISQNLEKFWQIDTYGTLPKFNPDILLPEQKRALHILESTTVIKDNKFEVGLLWKKDNIILPYNRELTEKRLYSLEKRFTKNPHFKHLYEQQINDYIEKGYGKKLSENELPITSN